ncbi:segregation/condensation protein A [Patescibacteria group bacterium]|nr:segregation/condensation protein A [Patescibacteria group bacterium]MBU4512631.1 segregation/condensation protein A [Patescibacteria group bacterium]MCG2693537.1 segregation/condensation protein A [Candidatus Parcubacteria bacterium]
MPQYTIKLNQFEGPLDILLKLIEKEELDITQVSLSRVTDQYIEYVQKLEDKFNPDELADFLVVATRLLLIKSKTLLPQLELDSEETGEELERQLKMYKAFLEAAGKIEARLKERRFIFFREKLPRDLHGVFRPPRSVNVQVLARTFKEIVGGLEVIPKLKERGIKKVISIKEKIKQIISIIKKAECGFYDIIKNSNDRTEVVISFLAILELVKQKQVAVVQEQGFGEIRIERVKLGN